MNYINTTTLAQLSEGEIRALNPNTSFANPFLPPEGYALVFPTPVPVHDSVTQRTQATTPELTALGHWEQRWEVVDIYINLVERDVAIAASQAKAAEALQAAIVSATQARLDTWAATRGFDGVLSGCTYATSSVPRFQQDGQDCVTGRDQTWAAVYAIPSRVASGEIPAPTCYADIEPLLPTLTWTNA